MVDENFRTYGILEDVDLKSRWDKYRVPGRWYSGEVMRHLRQAKEMSQTTLAKKAGIASSTLSGYEVGQKPYLRLSIVYNIAKAVGMDDPMDLERLARAERAHCYSCDYVRVILEDLGDKFKINEVKIA